MVIDPRFDQWLRETRFSFEQATNEMAAAGLATPGACFWTSLSKVVGGSMLSVVFIDNQINYISEFRHHKRIRSAETGTKAAVEAVLGIQRRVGSVPCGSSNLHSQPDEH